MNMEFETTKKKEKQVLGMYYRAYIKIDLDCITENILAMKKNLKEGTSVAAVIKTDGYGHGAVPIAHALKNIVEAFAVATVEEAINLRKHEIKNDIYILGFLPENRIDDVIEYEIRPAVFEYEMAQKISKKAAELGKTAKIHLKTDTGMRRIGFPVNEVSVQMIKEISKLPNIEIEGLFTHFACADSGDKTMTEEQYQSFCWLIHRLEQEGIKIKIKHCNNSAGIIDFPNTSLDMVRAGIALYGMYPSNEVNKKTVPLRPALSMKSHIIYLKEVDAGQSVSYGSTFVTTRKTLIATIPVGYGDGYPRNLSNRGFVLIHGKRARILGRICMDQFMADVTDIEEVCQGDEVTLIGRDKEDCITVEELAETGKGFHYEIVCDLGKRIPRVYYKDKKLVCKKDYFEDHYDILL